MTSTAGPENAELNLAIKQNAGFVIEVLFKTSSGATGAPRDWSGVTSAELVIADASDNALLTLNLGSGLAFGASDGILTITMTAAQTAALPTNQKLFYDVLVQESPSEPERLLEGRAYISKGYAEI